MNESMNHKLYIIQRNLSARLKRYPLSKNYSQNHLHSFVTNTCLTHKKDK